MKERIEENNPVEAYNRELDNVINLHDLPLEPGQTGSGINDVLRIYTKRPAGLRPCGIWVPGIHPGRAYIVIAGGYAISDG